MNRSRLFQASCVALIVTAMSFALRGNAGAAWAHDFTLTNEDVGWINSTAFWGFTLAMVSLLLSAGCGGGAIGLSTHADELRNHQEASESRMYCGIHFRSDIEVGKTHGKRIGGYTVSFARIDGADIR